MNPRDLAALMRKWVGMTVEDERPKRATVTAIANRGTTGEIEATMADGHKVYIHAATVYDIGVSDVVYVQKQPVGLAQARYVITSYHKSAGGSYIPTVRPESGGSIDDILMDDSSVELMDDSGVYLVED